MAPDSTPPPNATIKPYVNNYFEYERWADHVGVDGSPDYGAQTYFNNDNFDWRLTYRLGTRYRVTKEIAQGVGCSCTADGGLGIFNFQYVGNYEQAQDPTTGNYYLGYYHTDFNVWRNKTTEYLPDGNENEAERRWRQLWKELGDLRALDDMEARKRAVDLWGRWIDAGMPLGDHEQGGQ